MGSIIYAVGIHHIWKPLHDNYNQYSQTLCNINNITINTNNNKFYLSFDVSYTIYNITKHGISYESIPNITYPTIKDITSIINKYNISHTVNCHTSNSSNFIYLNYDINTIDSMIFNLTFTSYFFMALASTSLFYTPFMLLGGCQLKYCSGMKKNITLS
ncbi:Transmembrane domain-containing protein [Orpheovirus IHUMI-LCC2]|uniref:Transmembrane domain-containing protein n=1 Tax=Orpheovirus IHUMI-LCC2 TaxID=2023057 RepID=A0A2I2L4X2_9VIRU|nr:Transmembrane domain-containing protein [Orpheovirus IHUMI-LCC2]SNW62583.1 Transmembrane domain-containing protein [Orpheovirus IHUMI-LCC2]